MTAAVNNPEDVINISLVRIGAKRVIGSILDGSKAAQAALRIYAQTRDDLLRTRDFGFARRDIDMTILKQAPAGGYIPGVSPWNPAQNPPPPWAFEYLYPSDCLRVRSVKPVPIFVQNFNPLPYVFAIDNDNSGDAPVKVILCNVAPTAILTYTGQVTNPAEMDADFIEVLVAALGRGLAPALTENGLDVAKLEAQVQAQADTEADTTQG